MASNLTDTSLIINGTQEITGVSTVLAPNSANTEIITGKAFIDFLLQKKILVVPTSLAVSGDWLSTQYTDTAVNARGLSFTITYNDGFENIITPTNISPSTWGSTPGTQTATFSYTENGVTVATTKTATVKESPKPVGGIIFYIDTTADGTYTFYNSNGTQVSAPTVGTDCTGWTYTVEGASKDRYYVVYDNLYTSKVWVGSTVTQIGASGTAIGTGRSNTTIGLSSPANVSDSIWKTIQSMRTNNTGGCDDWFVGSKDEIERLRLSGVGNASTWFSGNNIWSSSEASRNLAYGWLYFDSGWDYPVKSNALCVCGVRAF